MLGCVGQQCQMSGTLYGQRQPALMSGTRTRLSAWADLASVAEKAPQQGDILVVDLIDLLQTERAHLSTTPVPALPAPRSRRRSSASWSRSSIGRSARRLG
jgi:hypothetical protein